MPAIVSLVLDLDFHWDFSLECELWS